MGCPWHSAVSAFSSQYDRHWQLLGTGTLVLASLHKAGFKESKAPISWVIVQATASPQRQGGGILYHTGTAKPAKDPTFYFG
jgi:hypothetical protein